MANEQLNGFISPSFLPSPKSLDLTAVNEGILWDNIKIFRQNGFDFVKEEATGKWRII